MKEKNVRFGLKRRETAQAAESSPHYNSSTGADALVGARKGRDGSPGGRASSLRNGPTLVLIMGAEPLEPIFTSRNLPLLWHAL